MTSITHLGECFRMTLKDPAHNQSRSMSIMRRKSAGKSGEDHLEDKYLEDLRSINIYSMRNISDETLKTNIRYLDRRMNQKLLNG